MGTSFTGSSGCHAATPDTRVAGRCGLSGVKSRAIGTRHADPEPQLLESEPAGNRSEGCCERVGIHHRPHPGRRRGHRVCRVGQAQCAVARGGAWGSRHPVVRCDRGFRHLSGRPPRVGTVGGPRGAVSGLARCMSQDRTAAEYWSNVARPPAPTMAGVATEMSGHGVS